MTFLGLALLVMATADTTGATPDTMVVPLPEVVVAGTRTRESAGRAPAAASVVERGSFLDRRGISLGDALQDVPGVFVQSRSGAQDVRISIRGFGARGAGGRSNSGALRGIRVMLDGVPVTEPDGRTSLDLIDLQSADRIEVLRSNASVLYGNASGGIVNLHTDLSFASPYLEARVNGGAYGYRRGQLMAGWTAAHARAVLSAYRSDFSGWRENSESRTTQASAHVRADLDPRSRLGIHVTAADNLNRFPGPLTEVELGSDPSRADPAFLARGERRRNRLARVALSLDHSAASEQDFSANLYVEPKVLERSQRGTFRDFTRYHLGGAATYQLRRNHRGGLESRWTLGADEAWQDGAILFYDLTADGMRGDTLRENRREGANSAGAFAQGELRWNARWSVQLGVRFDHQLYLSKDRMNPALDDRASFRRWTPRATLSFLGERRTAYVALGGGVEAPAFNEVNPPPELAAVTSFNPFLEPMTSTTLEIGSRGELAHIAAGPLRYDAALYWIEVRSDLIPYDGGRYYFTAGRSRRLGAELGLGWTPVERLSLDGALTVSQNEFVEYTSADSMDLAGNRQPGISPGFYSGAVRYAFRDGLAAEVRVDGSAGYFADEKNLFRARAYALLGASLSFSRAFPGGELRVFVSGANLTDERYVSSVFINGSQGRMFEPGMPRNGSAGLTYRWP